MTAATATLPFPSNSRSAEPSTWTVADLLAGLGKGDAAAWSELVRRYQGLLVGRARRFRLQEADLLDAVQTTWQRLAEHWDAIEQPERLSGWLATTVARECIRIVNGYRAWVPDADVAAGIADPQPGPEQHAVDADTAIAVRELVDTLPEHRRAIVLALFDDERPTYAEIARRLGVPVGSIGPTRARCLSNLRALAEVRDLAPGA
jgi:RNA polymerase sigma factor (sigma-70 family)